MATLAEQLAAKRERDRRLNNALAQGAVAVGRRDVTFQGKPLGAPDTRVSPFATVSQDATFEEAFGSPTPSTISDKLSTPVTEPLPNVPQERSRSTARERRELRTKKLGSSEGLARKDLIGTRFESSLQTKPQSTRFGGTNLVNQFDRRVQRNLEQRASTLAESQRNKRTNQLLDQLRIDRDDVLNNTLGLGKSTARERIAAISGFNEAVGDLALSGGRRGAEGGSRGRGGKTFEEELLLKQIPTGDKLLGLGFDRTKLASEERRALSGRLSREGIAANSELRQRRSSRAQRAQEGFSRSALAEEAFQDNDIVEGLGYLDIDIFDLLGGDEDTSRDSMEKLINSGLTNDDIVNIKRDLVNRIQVGR